LSETALNKKVLKQLGELQPQGLINFEKGKLNATVIWTRIDLGKSLNNVLS